MEFPPQILVLEGIIGSGKTTLCKHLEQFWKERGYNVVIIPEPVKTWKTVGILEAFYKDQKRYSYDFQTFVCVTRIKNVLDMIDKYKNSKVDIWLFERSIFSDRYFFVDMLIENGMFSPMEVQMYNEWWDTWKRALPPSMRPTKFIYLNTSLKECLRRIRERDRKGEESVGAEYQKKLQDKHEEFFQDSFVSIDGKKVPVLRLNTDGDFRKENSLLEAIAEDIIPLSSQPRKKVEIQKNKPETQQKKEIQQFVFSLTSKGLDI